MTRLWAFIYGQGPGWASQNSSICMVGPATIKT